MIPTRLVATSLLCLLLTRPAPLGAQRAVENAPAAAAAAGVPVAIFGPPPPIAPETAARDAAGRLTIRAVRLDSPLHVDGKLDEAVYNDQRDTLATGFPGLVNRTFIVKVNRLLRF